LCIIVQSGRNEDSGVRHVYAVYGFHRNIVPAGLFIDLCGCIYTLLMHLMQPIVILLMAKFDLYTCNNATLLLSAFFVVQLHDTFISSTYIFLVMEL
jgi:hypothetical protein